MVMFAGFRNKPRVLIFGTGAGGVNFYKSCRGRYKVIGFLDNNQQKHGQTLFGKRIHAPQTLGNLAFEHIIIASDYFREIQLQLVNELAVSKDKISTFHEQPVVPSRFQILRSRVEFLVYELICKPGLMSGLLYRLFLGNKAQSRAGSLKRFDLRWLDNAVENKVRVFRPAVAGSVQGPRHINHTVSPTRITLPEVALYAFQQAQFCSVSRSAILPDGQLVVERVTTSSVTDADYGGAHLVYHGQAFALARTSEVESIDKGILISGGSELNYYHWLLEILSQLQFISELPDQYADYPVLISHQSQKIPSIKALIAAIGISRPVVLLKSITSYRANDLLLISAPNNCIPNYKDSARSVAESSFARPESIQFLREKALSLTAGIARDALSKRIFLGRKGHLRHYNQSEVIARLEPLGFVCVYMEEQDINHQVALMANAEIIIGPTGAAWANIMFASKGTKALCWMAEESGALACFSNLADIVGVEMDYITYDAQTSNSRELYYKGYSIDTDTIINWLGDSPRPSAD
jgi:capsular polysaccharide biosynthesis protein